MQVRANQLLFRWPKADPNSKALKPSVCKTFLERTAKMSSSELVNYQLQLQQVEAALITDPTNEELIKLKSDLTEAIELTKSLLGVDEEIEPEDLISQSASITQSNKFQVGDPCQAPWSEDGQFYEATIEDLTSDGQCNVVFHYLPNGKFKVSEVCLVSLLKPSETQRKKKDAPGAAKKDSKLSRDQIKKRQQKKQSRFKDLEEAREKDKNKWKQFNAKAANKGLKGATTLIKQNSIFKSPDSVQGRVGVGTCGINSRTSRCLV